MNRKTLMAAAIAAAMMTMTVSLFAAEQPAAPAQKSEPIYGYRMMNDQERNEYRERMRNAPSAEARQKVRDEHRQLMETRAKERGVTLPEPRGPRGPGYGPGGQGKGPGYGPGGQGKGYGPGGQGKGPGYGPGGQGKGYGPGGQGKGYGKGAGYGPGGQGKGPGYGPGGQGKGYGKGPGYGPGPRGDCPAGQDCPGPGRGPGAGKGAAQ
jgi:hypothetical protein